MSAIAGILDLEARGLQIDEGRLLGAAARRGPVRREIYRRGPAYLLHVRPEGEEDGAQPVLLPARGGMALVWDGAEEGGGALRRELERLGHGLQGRCAALEAAHAYAEWGMDCVRRLEGAFALAVWEEERSRLFLARGRAEGRPLFTARTEGRLAFASAREALPEGLGAGWEVQALGSGCCACWSQSGWRSWRW